MALASSFLAPSASYAVILVFVVGVAVVGLFAFLGYYASKKRREAFATLATRRGWTYVERDDRWTETFDGAPFGQGHNRKAQNVVAGSFDGRGFVSFDYTYYTTSTSTDGQGHTTSHEDSHDFGVVAIDTGTALPALAVTPEGMVGRLIGRLTNRDIELESEDFNRAFTVTCPDRKFASDVLHPQMMEFLLTHRDTSFRFDGQWVLSATGGQAAIESIEPRLGIVDGVLDRVPEFVWQDLRGPV